MWRRGNMLGGTPIYVSHCGCIWMFLIMSSCTRSFFHLDGAEYHAMTSSEMAAASSTNLVQVDFSKTGD